MQKVFLLSSVMKRIHHAIEERYHEELKNMGILVPPEDRKIKYGFQVQQHQFGDPSGKKKPIENLPPSIGSIMRLTMGNYIEEKLPSFNNKNLYEYDLAAKSKNEVEVRLPYLEAYLKFIGFESISDFLDSLNDADIRSQQLNLLKHVLPNRENTELLTTYDAYGYSIHRADFFYYFIKILQKRPTKSKSENEYDVSMNTYKINGEFEESYSGILTERGNYGYFHFHIKNAENKIKREFYIICFLGDKTILNANVLYSAYIISSRNMSLSSGFLIMKQEGEQLDRPKELSLLMKRYFNLHKPQIRFDCKTPMNFQEIKFPNDNENLLLELVGQFIIIMRSSNLTFQAFYLTITESFKSFIVDKHQTDCNLFIKSGNLIINPNQEISIGSKNTIILKIHSKLFLTGHYIGTDVNGIPETGPAIMLQSDTFLDKSNLSIMDLTEILKKYDRLDALTFLTTNS